MPPQALLIQSTMARPVVLFSLEKSGRGRGTPRFVRGNAIEKDTRGIGDCVRRAMAS